MKSTSEGSSSWLSFSEKRNKRELLPTVEHEKNPWHKRPGEGEFLPKLVCDEPEKESFFSYTEETTLERPGLLVSGSSCKTPVGSTTKYPS